MYDYESCENSTVTVASSHELPIFGDGKLLISTVGDYGQQTFIIDRVAHVPDLDVNLFSIQSVVVERDYPVRISRERSIITLPSGKEAFFKRAGRFDVMVVKRINNSPRLAKTAQSKPEESANAVLALGKMSSTPI